jgi:hypothetical protein
MTIPPQYRTDKISSSSTAAAAAAAANIKIKIIKKKIIKFIKFI